MPYADNKGVKIYYEVEGQGPPLVLAHGFWTRLNSWRGTGYANALKNDFQLLLFDARGHGRSDKPYEASAWGLTNLADDVVVMLDHAGIQQANYFGFSMGAKVGYNLAKRHVERFLSFIFHSHTPYRDEGDVKSRQDILDRLNVFLNDPEAYVWKLEQDAGRPMPPEQRKAYLATDARSLIAAMTVATGHTDVTLTDQELSLISVPCLVLCGDLDLYYAGARQAAGRMPHAEFFPLPGLDHVQSFVRSDLVLPHVKKFLAEVAKA